MALSKEKLRLTFFSSNEKIYDSNNMNYGLTMLIYRI